MFSRVCAQGWYLEYRSLILAEKFKEIKVQCLLCRVSRGKKADYNDIGVAQC